MEQKMPTKSQELGERKTHGLDEDLIVRIVKANPEITVEGMNNEGDVLFSVMAKNIGTHQSEISSSPITRTCFFVNLLGELLVRKNINIFASILIDLDPKAYDSVVNCFNHRNFGMVMTDITNGTYRFQFHVSLVQSILTEDVYKVFEV